VELLGATFWHHDSMAFTAPLSIADQRERETIIVIEQGSRTALP